MLNAAPHFAASVVLRAFLNGTEAAVKRPKIKVTLNPRELKNFSQEVTTMLKASSALRPPCLFCRLLTACAGESPSLRADIQCQLEIVRAPSSGWTCPSRSSRICTQRAVQFG
jgi:hypothetical protein